MLYYCYCQCYHSYSSTNFDIVLVWGSTNQDLYTLFQIANNSGNSATTGGGVTNLLMKCLALIVLQEVYIMQSNTPSYYISSWWNVNVADDSDGFIGAHLQCLQLDSSWRADMLH